MKVGGTAIKVQPFDEARWYGAECMKEVYNSNFTSVGRIFLSPTSIRRIWSWQLKSYFGFATTLCLLRFEERFSQTIRQEHCIFSTLKQVDLLGIFDRWKSGIRSHSCLSPSSWLWYLHHPILLSRRTGLAKGVVWLFQIHINRIESTAVYNGSAKHSVRLWKGFRTGSNQPPTAMNGEPTEAGGWADGPIIGHAWPLKPSLRYLPCLKSRRALAF